MGVSAMSGGDFGVVNIENCYSTGKVSSTDQAGGLVGTVAYSSIDVQDSWSSANIAQSGVSLGESSFGGLAGFILGYINADNCHALGNVTVMQNDVYAGGFVGCTLFDESFGLKISNCSSAGKVTAPSSSQYVGGFIGYAQSGYNNCIENCYYNNVENSSLGGIGKADYFNGASYTLEGKSRSIIEKMLPNYVASQKVEFGLQVGIYGSASSSLHLETSFVLDGLFNLYNIGIDDVDYLSQIDTMLEVVSAKQTEFGSISNRLESVLDEITIQYENLVSSRSTIRDADMAELSSTYIQQQILQEASATLLASTKNIQYQNVLGLLQGLRG